MLQDGRITHTIYNAHEHRITSILLVNEHIWTSCAGGIIKVWDAGIRRLSETIATEMGHVKCLILVTKSDSNPQVWSSSPRQKVIQCWNSEVCFKYYISGL